MKPSKHLPMQIYKNFFVILEAEQHYSGVEKREPECEAGQLLVVDESKEYALH